ncbi:nurim homolog [Copidosoma floridanum]|uniref:nurim homolog n=1 Tax=Copidosoma floridanum TaxID=29053 RepID=UPI0006C9D3CD|nr:nurim homolog [Copidosoma floridanum]
MFTKVLRVAVCTCSFFYTFYVLCHLTYFLSKRIDYDENVESEKGENLAVKALWHSLINFGLISVFILQHSVMASDSVKDLYAKFNVEDVERSIYNISASAVLHFLISTWMPVPWVFLWNFNNLQGGVLWYILSLIQVIGWCIVYIGCIMMDISELAGLKQVYYKLSGRPCPMALKSRELQRYFMHMRHPSFTGFLMILWIHPLMSIDRFMMASLLTAYMALMWTIDMGDYSYHSIIITRKEMEINYKKH